ncbi:TPA: fimbrial protein [Enterobacter cloacae]|nr:fimbrial protein [Enterobacter cloacae]
MIRMIVSLVFLILVFFCRTAMAWDCSTVTPSTTLSPQNITLSRDLPVGAVIGSQIITPTFKAFSCNDSQVGAISNQSFGIKAIGTFDSMINGVRVYKTNVDGIGYSVSGKTANCASGNVAVTGNNTIRGDINTALLCQNTAGIINTDLSGSIAVTFYKTAMETGSGIISAKMVGSLILLTNSLLWQSPEAAVNINSFSVTTPACKLTTVSTPVNMKEVDKNAFNGKGTTPGEVNTQSFSLPMSCNAGTSVSIKLEGNIYDATKGVINTTSGNNAATGVGIQLLYNNLPMMLGSDVAVGTSNTGGSFSIPLKARYYQTGERITPGTANGVLSFTMTYR